VTFESITDRTAAEELRGTELRITVPADSRPDDPEEFYDHHLVGLRADTASGEPLGRVTEVLHLPAQDVLVVRHDGRDVLVPFVRDIVPEIELDAGRLVVADLPGLLDDPSAGPERPSAAGVNGG
jgi:16S rRNA processing protein RimM